MKKLKSASVKGLNILDELLNQTHLKKKHFSKGDLLLKQGQIVRELYRVNSGFISLDYCCHSGKRFRLGTYWVTKHLFGDSEFLTHEPCQYNVRVHDNITVEIIPFSLLLELLHTQPEISIWLCQNLAQRNQQRSNDLIQKIINPLHYNIALDFYQRSCGTAISYNYDNMQKDSERFGCTSRAYSRVISDLIAHKLIQKNNGTITVNDIEKLKRYIDDF